MNLTVNTDASFNFNHKIGTYAFWVVSNMGREQKSGRLKGRIEDPTEAEMKAICNAMSYISHNHDVMIYVKTIFINTDSMNAIHVFNDDVRKRKKYKLYKPFHKNLQKEFDKIRKTFLGKEIVIRHVKAHCGVEEKRTYVNDWLDRAAKMEMREYLAELERKSKQSWKKIA